jgi:DNA-binding response OmpR family regulator
MSKPRILLVDDEPDIGIIVRLLCRDMGVEVSRCDTVAAALPRLGDAYALVLLDVNLTGESGVRLLEQKPPGERPPVALFCQQELTGDLAAGWRAGADFVVAKGLVTSPERWRDRLSAILAGRERGPSVFCRRGDVPALLRRLFGPELAEAVWGRVAPDETGDRERRGAELVEQAWRLFGPEASVAWAAELSGRRT